MATKPNTTVRIGALASILIALALGAAPIAALVALGSQVQP